MRRVFFIASASVLLLLALAGWFWAPALWLYVPLLPLVIMGLMDAFQTRHAVRRNFPILGNLRYFFEFIRPELQQYFVESDLSGRPINRAYRSIVYQRAKGALQSRPFGTQQDVYEAGYEWVNHSINPKHNEPETMFVTIGGPACKKPYRASVFNISAMSYGALSHAAVEALNLGALKGGFYHNTGEGGISPYHLKGGDLVWQLGTGYFGARQPDGRFCDKTFQEKVKWPQIKMIEVKLSQGAKPGKGGLLPASKVTPEIVEIRGVVMGKDVISPASHPEFSTPMELLKFIERLRTLSSGKPVGFKLCVGKKSEFFAICKAMVESKIMPDFITVDGGEGGTGAAPLEFSDSVGMPLEDGLAFVHDCLVGFDLRKHIRVIAAGKTFSSFHMISKMALGADIINSARGMMLALGCIQALQCNANTCPVGVATQDEDLVRGLHIPSKAERVYRFHKETVYAFAEVLGAMGYSHPSQLRREDINRRMSNGKIKTHEDRFPSVAVGAFLADLSKVPEEYRKLMRQTTERTFEMTAS